MASLFYPSVGERTRSKFFIAIERVKTYRGGAAKVASARGPTASEELFTRPRHLCGERIAGAVAGDAIEASEQRVIDAALRARSLGAYAIRTRILEEVTTFCGGIFSG